MNALKPKNAVKRLLACGIEAGPSPYVEPKSRRRAAGPYYVHNGRRRMLPVPNGFGDDGFLLQLFVRRVEACTHRVECSTTDVERMLHRQHLDEVLRHGPFQLTMF